jgi:hypothetical protein
LSRKKKSGPRTTAVDQARNDLFGHINRCGVLQATEEQQVEWMDDTIDYIGECYPSLSREELDELKAVGLRFCRPAIPHGAGNNARDEELDEELNGAEEPASAA